MIDKYQGFVDCCSVQYVKQLSPSDAACSKQIKLPKSLAKRFIGELRHKQSTIVTVLDQLGGSWDFLCTCYGCQYALSRVGAFCTRFSLKAGQFLVFYTDSQIRLRVGASSSIPQELQQRFAHRPLGSGKGGSSSGKGAGPLFAAAACTTHSGGGSSASDVSEHGVLGKRAHAALQQQKVQEGCWQAALDENVARVMSKQVPASNDAAQTAWSRAPSPEDSILHAAALALEGAFSAQPPAISPTIAAHSQLHWCMQQQQLAADAFCIISTSQQRPVKRQCSSMEQPDGSLPLQQQPQDAAAPVLFAPLCRSHSGSDSSGSTGTCASMGGAAAAAPSNSTQQELQLQGASGMAWPAAAAASRLLPPTTACAASAPVPAVLAAAASAPVQAQPMPLLAKRLTKMDVACAHDSVGIVLPLQEVLRSQLLTTNMRSLHFIVSHESNAALRFSCRVAASADGRFAYLTGLGQLLAGAGARAGDELRVSVALGAAGLVAGVRRL